MLSTIELKLRRMTTDALSRVFAAFADPTRRDMVARLSEADATVSQLAEPYRMTLQAVYKHLRVLEDAGLVSRTPGPQPRSVHLEVQVFDLMDTWYSARPTAQKAGFSATSTSRHTCWQRADRLSLSVPAPADPGVGAFLG